MLAEPTNQRLLKAGTENASTKEIPNSIANTRSFMHYLFAYHMPPKDSRHTVLLQKYKNTDKIMEITFTRTMHCCKPVRIVNTTLEVTSQVQTQCSNRSALDTTLELIRCNVVLQLYQHYRYHNSD